VSERKQPAAAPAAPAVVNPDLKAVHTALLDLVAKLDASIPHNATAAQVNAITDEIAEVFARVNSVQRQLLTQQTAAISRHAAAVAKAIPDVEAAIKQIEDLRAFVGGVTKFLAIVDKAIDVAKLVV
jgi:hypothetical protein